MKKRSNPKIEAMRERSLMLESERTNYERKYSLNEQAIGPPEQPSEPKEEYRDVDSLFKVTEKMRLGLGKIKGTVNLYLSPEQKDQSQLYPRQGVVTIGDDVMDVESWRYFLSRNMRLLKGGSTVVFDEEDVFDRNWLDYLNPANESNLNLNVAQQICAGDDLRKNGYIIKIGSVDTSLEDKKSIDDYTPTKSPIYYVQPSSGEPYLQISEEPMRNVRKVYHEKLTNMIKNVMQTGIDEFMKVVCMKPKATFASVDDEEKESDLT